MTVITKRRPYVGAPLSLSKNTFFDKLSKFFEQEYCIKMSEKLVD